MPYSIARGKGCSPGKPWAVVKDTDGSVVACHETKEGALSQIRALYAAEPALAKARERLEKDAVAPPKDRISGSAKNEPGSASGKTGDVDVSDGTEKALQTKADAHNEKMKDQNKPNWTRVSVGALRAVYRRGSGAFSVSHRPGIGRGQWAMARVNAFLVLASNGKPANPKYVGDNDLLHADHPRYTKNTEKHLAGKHDQSSHGSGGGISSAPAQPRPKRDKLQIAADDQRAHDLHEQGMSWEQVAQEVGFANGGVARRAGMRHAERQKADDDTTGKKPDDDTTPIRKPDDTPPIIDIVTPPRPMTDTDPSVQRTPTEDMAEAIATGRPYKPFTHEGRSQQVRDAEENVLRAEQHLHDYEKQHDPVINARIAELRKPQTDYEQAYKKRTEELPRTETESSGEYAKRVHESLKADGIVEPPYTGRNAYDDAIKSLMDEGALPADYRQKTDALRNVVQQAHSDARRVYTIDSAEHLLGTKMTREPIMVTDWDAPRDPVTGERPMKQDVYDYGDKKGQPRFRDMFVTPDGERIPLDDILSPDNSDDPDRFWKIKEVGDQRHKKSIHYYEQRRWRRDDPTFGARETEMLRRQQAIVDDPNTRIVLHAPVSAVGGIVTGGRWKSQHETGRTKGFKGEDTRAGFEAGSIGTVSATAPEKADRSKAPIYGALHIGGVRAPEAVGAEQYGEVGFVLKRETHERATWTNGDSLSHCYEPSPLTGRQTKPNGHSVNGGVDVGTFDPAKDTPERFQTDLSPAPRRLRTYAEAQVLGGVSLADVDYVTIPKGTKLPETTRKKLAKAGIPIVEYDMADVAPPVVGVHEYYPDGKPPYTTPRYAEGGDYANLPTPTGKRAFVANIWKHLAGGTSRRRPGGAMMTPTVTVKHLAGKHDQSTHGRGGGIGASREESRAKQKQAWELHEQGKTWEEVAKLAGYANGGAARLAGLQHKKRLDAEGAGGGADKPDVGDTTPTPVTPKEGAEAIAQARALVDAATGGRPVADVLADERKKVNVPGKVAQDAPPTAKEIEIEQAVTQAGAILRAEVARRQMEAGAERKKIAEERVAELEEVVKVRQKNYDEAQDKVAEAQVEFHDAVIKTPEFEAQSRVITDAMLQRVGDYGGKYATGIVAVRNADRDVTAADMRELAIKATNPRGDNFARLGENEAWVIRRAQERFPGDPDAQAAYAMVLNGAGTVYSETRMNLLRSNPQIQQLKNNVDGASVASLNEYNALSVDERRLRSEKQVIADNGITDADRTRITREVLTEAGRTMTDKPGQPLRGTKALQGELRDELTKIPDELWDDKRFKDLKVKAVSRRGHWSRSKEEIATDGSGGRRGSTLLHEATHAVEDMNPAIAQLQYTMFKRRQGAEPVIPLSKIMPGMGYRRSEVGVRDQWKEGYAGKTYGKGRYNNYEIMTTGIEALYSRGGYPGADNCDDDHLNFVMGVLAYA